MLTVKQSASLLSISASKVYELVAARRISHFKIDGKILFEEADLTAFKESCRVGVAEHTPPPIPRLTLKHVSLGPAGTRGSGSNAGNASRASSGPRVPQGSTR